MICDETFVTLMRGIVQNEGCHTKYLNKHVPALSIVAVVITVVAIIIIVISDII